MSRSITPIATTPFQQYDLEGPVQPDMTWLPISYRKESGVGSYLMRMLPGAQTIAHDHPGYEEFVMLEGEPPSFVRYGAMRRADVFNFPIGSCASPLSAIWRRDITIPTDPDGVARRQ